MNRISKNEALLSLVTAASLLMASCHDARRSNPVDPAGIVDVDIAVSAVEDSTATIAWTPYTGDVEFSHYLVLRRADELGATADTVEVLDDRWVIHVSRPDTIARIEDLSVTSYTDTVIPNIPFTYQVSVINAGGLESTSVESAPVLTVAPRISFYTNRDGNGEVYVMNEDGRALANLTNHPGIDGQVVNSVEGRPAWSPDGSRIAFVSSRDGNAEIYVMMADGSDPTNMTNDPGYDSFPKWSPDGGRIAFTSDRSGSWEVWVMAANGTDLRQLTDSPDADGWAAWSPDGTRIAFTSRRDGNYEIYIMDADGSEQRNLTNSSDRHDWDADWSPDGTRIVWELATLDFSEGDIFVMDPDGGNVINLTNSGIGDGWPDWSPDGTRIAFTSSRDGNQEIYLMDADGSNQVNITNHPFSDFFPDWQPMVPR